MTNVQDDVTMSRCGTTVNMRECCLL